MPRRHPAQPVLTDVTIRRLIEMEKPVRDSAWRDSLLPGTRDAVTWSGRFDLDDVDRGPDRGSLHIYSRQSLARGPGDWSTGLIFTPLGRTETYPLIRLNGPHLTVHKNTLDPGPPIVAAPHIHYLTERYQNVGKVNSGYAEPTDAYASLEEAVDTLEAMANLVGDGILMFRKR